MQSGFDINKLREAAQNRWLKPSEVMFILENHERYRVTLEAPKMPPSGSLFLINRRVVRFYRKDGHAWRKKKDGRTVGEAHERLKVGNVDALNCYYAHGEQNPHFQRRSYWILDPAYDHIVLVHYREVSEGRYIYGSISNLSGESFSAFSETTSIDKTPLQGFTSGASELQEPYQNSSSPGSVEEVSSRPAANIFGIFQSNAVDSSGQPEVDKALQKLATQLSLDDDDVVYIGEKLPEYCSQFESSQNLRPSDYKTKSSSQDSHESLLHEFEYRMHNQVEDTKHQDIYSGLDSLSGNNEEQQIQSLDSGYFIENNQSPSWKDMLELTSNSPGKNSLGGSSNLFTPGDLAESSGCRTSKLEAQFPFKDIPKNGHDVLGSAPEREKISENLTWEQLDHGVMVPTNCPKKHQTSESDFSLQLSATRMFLLGSDTPVESPTSVSHFLEVDRLHSLGTSTLVANSSDMMFRKENSADWMGDIGSTMENGIYSSDILETWLDPNQSGNSLRTDSSLTVAQNQRFSIREISPEWAFSSENSKVVIIGEFLCNPSEFTWAIMFGDIEVPLEIVQEGVLRCQAPQHGAGKVALCITSANRESCSEIREFEFRTKPNTSSVIGSSLPVEATKSTEELTLIAKFANILFRGYDGSSVPEDGVEMEIKHPIKNQWQQIIETLQGDCESPSDILDWIVQELLKDKFHQWLMSKHQGDNGSVSLSKEEQGIIHMISGLGYEWALSPILDLGVGINFRDVKGWTALHWAAHFGREKIVAALIAAGSSAGAVTDPTPQDSVGKTAGAISSASGYKGLAGYLSEVDLTSHLSSLMMEESEISKASAIVEAEIAVESISQKSVQMHIGGTEDELSLKDSLAAVRNSAQAAARIQAAFRAHSFRKRQQKADANLDEYGLTPEDILGFSAVSKFQRAVHYYNGQKFDKAALSIQKKYRGWKGRKNFLTLRQHVVKIQALVRGHQMRKKYKEFLWTVGVVEKVILRWRRKGVGLRGFRAEPEVVDEAEDEDIAKVFRKQKVDAALDQAVSRVLSMVKSPDARHQYRRMLEKYRQAKAEASNVDEAISTLDFEIVENADYMY